jgi:hypothetical protein
MVPVDTKTVYDGPAKQAIFDFVRTTIDRSSPNWVPPENRIATFDQDGDGHGGTLITDPPVVAAGLPPPKAPPACNGWRRWSSRSY